ncbi:MAG: hypothetical protein V7L29_02240 [Nostoc sp.]|uniref:hypothetical protein n=1 Tax=Nostoc sp. TaxID=1180 RepID=UPI002FF470BA
MERLVEKEYGYAQSNDFEFWIETDHESEQQDEVRVRGLSKDARISSNKTYFAHAWTGHEPKKSKI